MLCHLPLGSKSCRGINRHSISVEDIKELMLVVFEEKKRQEEGTPARKISQAKKHPQNSKYQPWETG